MLLAALLSLAFADGCATRSPDAERPAWRYSSP